MPAEKPTAEPEAKRIRDEVASWPPLPADLRDQRWHSPAQPENIHVTLTAA